MGNVPILKKYAGLFAVAGLVLQPPLLIAAPNSGETQDVRRDAAVEAVQRVMRRQQRGSVRSDLDAGRSLLAMIALSWFPLAFPQLTRLITGQSSSEERFRKPYREFLGRFAISFRGKGLNRAKNGKAVKDLVANGK